MNERIRNAPEIPDHEVLRKIGGGSYGEVWMARSVTDVLRAIKVVWRSDFDSERDFEREFEGIKNYEPISRSHPGLIPILHVGRSKGDEEFYYHVMELADDVYEGQNFNPVEYSPRTLRTDYKAANGKPIDVDVCVDVGIEIGEALNHLHEAGLAHRDIKPANIVFSKGRPCLADIGLVAMPGQRTFVGTEGFVPPEGPGSRRADVYSFGKVLYEMATGKDRLDYPDLPSYEYGEDKTKRWRLLNDLICNMCEVKVSDRTVNRPHLLIDSLKRIQVGKRIKKPFPTKKLSLALVGLGLFFLFWVVFKNGPEALIEDTPSEPRFASMKIMSTPTGAEVWDLNGEYLGNTPLGGREAEVGKYAQYEFRLNGYRNTLSGNVVDSGGIVIDAQLPVFAPPEKDQPWSDVNGVGYKPNGEGHLSTTYILAWAVRKFLATAEEKKTKCTVVLTPVNNKNRKVVLMQEHAIRRYCVWLTNLCISEGYLTDDYEITPILDKKKSIKNTPKAFRRGFYPFHCEVKPIIFSKLMLEVVPNELEFLTYLDDELIRVNGETSMEIPRIKPGNHVLVVEAEGYNIAKREFKINDGEEKVIQVKLKPNSSVVFDEEWTNSLEMELIPLSESLMVSKYETTVANYAQFISEVKERRVGNPYFSQKESHPIVNVTREDAIEYCRWLTKKERAKFLIGEFHTYRLPTDLEWSIMTGLVGESGSTPAERDVSQEKVFAWGVEWPPIQNAGNFADTSASSAALTIGRVIKGYTDNYPYTSPVGSFQATDNGLYDVWGNVYEWVADDFGVGKYGVTRGGSWMSYQEQNLFLQFRNALSPEFSDFQTGFRVVLSKEL